MQALFWSGTIDNKSGFRCRHLGWLTGRGLVQRRDGGGGWSIFPFPPPTPPPTFPLNAYSLGKYFLAPNLHENVHSHVQNMPALQASTHALTGQSVQLEASV